MAASSQQSPEHTERLHVINIYAWSETFRSENFRKNISWFSLCLWGGEMFADSGVFWASRWGKAHQEQCRFFFFVLGSGARPASTFVPVLFICFPNKTMRSAAGWIPFLKSKYNTCRSGPGVLLHHFSSKHKKEFLHYTDKSGKASITQISLADVSPAGPPDYELGVVTDFLPETEIRGRLQTETQRTPPAKRHTAEQSSTLSLRHR